MDRELSEESRQLLHDMYKSEAWSIYETIQKDRIENLRILATRKETPTDDKHWYSAEAQGREDSINELKDLLYVRKQSE